MSAPANPAFLVQHSFASLPDCCYEFCQPTPVSAPQWLAFNQDLAEQLGLPADYHGTELGLQLFAGNQLPDWTQPLAQAYAGHQFANFVPRLGDGRAILLAEVQDQQQQVRDIQLKGSGPTPFSRGGDGRAALGPVMREYLLSEAMHALGVPSTRALAAVLTGDWVYRDTAQPGAILTRVGSSHLRIGSFQYIALQQATDPKQAGILQRYADYAIKRHYPHCQQQAAPYLALLAAVIDKQAQLVAHWMSLGFIHGVMNTDNCSISGETIDYGPCAFMEAYDPNTVFSAIDRRGRYAYGNQPAMALWNLTRLAEALLPLIDDEQSRAIALASEALQQFQSAYERQWLNRMAAKLGITQANAEDKPLIDGWLALLQQHQADFTRSFYLLSQPDTDALAESFQHSSAWQSWLLLWQQRLAQQGLGQAQLITQMHSVNPCVIPRNHLVQQAIDMAMEHGDLSLFQQLHRVWQQPFVDTGENRAFQQPATAAQAVTRTFCGT